MAELTPEVRARLKEYAAAKKGRKNLAGLDYTTGMVGFDFISESDYVTERCALEASGLFLAKGETTAMLKCVRAKKQSKYDACPWVRLKHCQGWQTDELAKRWPSRRVAVRTYQGPGVPIKTETAVLHPLDVVVAWFKFLWPKDWAVKLAKYAVGYTDRFVHDYPGVGAKVKMRTHPRLDLVGEVCQVVAVQNVWVNAHFIVTTATDIQVPVYKSGCSWDVIG